jgi:hypothetical protein
VLRQAAADEREGKGAGRGECSARPPLMSARRRLPSLAWDAAPDKHIASTEAIELLEEAVTVESSHGCPCSAPLICMCVHSRCRSLSASSTTSIGLAIDVPAAGPGRGLPGSWCKWRPGREGVSGTNRE